MRKKALKLTAALALTAAAALTTPPAQALISCSCLYCMTNLDAACTQSGFTWNCLSYVRNYCLA